jgi:hypothetical protein
MIVIIGATSTPAQAADARSAPTLQPNRCVFQAPFALLDRVSVGSSRGRHFTTSTGEAMLPGARPDLHPSAAAAPPLSSFMDNRDVYHCGHENDAAVLSYE